MRYLATLLLAVMLSGCSYTWAARATLIARDTGDAVSKGMAEQTRAVTAKCKEKCIKEGKLDVSCYRDCVAPWRVHRERFRKYAAPAISAAVAGAYTGIKLAKEAGDRDKATHYGLGAVCAALRIAEPFLPLIPEKYRAMVQNGAKFVKGLVCK